MDASKRTRAGAGTRVGGADLTEFGYAVLYVILVCLAVKYIENS